MEYKKKLSIKEYFLYMFLALFVFAVWYLGTAFVILDLNILNWEKSTRFMVLANGSITSIGIVINFYK
jgi:hypothetical protein